MSLAFRHRKDKSSRAPPPRMWGSSSETEQGLGEGAGSECYQV